MSSLLSPDYFDRWNSVKKSLNVENPGRFPKEGEVWMSSVGLNIGYEQNGSGSLFSRPLIIIKKFNNQMFWAAPLSTKQKQLDFYYNFTDPNGQLVSIVLAQLRLVSVKRTKRKMYELNPDKLRDIKDRLRQFLR